MGTATSGHKRRKRATMRLRVSICEEEERSVSRRLFVVKKPESMKKTFGASTPLAIIGLEAGGLEGMEGSIVKELLAPECEEECAMICDHA